MQWFRKRDTALGAALEKAGMTRAAMEVARLARLAAGTHRRDEDRLAAFERGLRRAGDLVMIEVIGDEAWRAAVEAAMAKALGDAAARNEMTAAEGRRRDADDEGQPKTAAHGSHRPGAPSSAQNAERDGRSALARVEPVMQCHRSAPVPGDEGLRIGAAIDGRRRTASSPGFHQKPRRAPRDLVAEARTFARIAANSLLASYHVDGRAIGSFTIGEARALATRRLGELAAEAVPFRVLKRVSEHAANLTGGELVSDVVGEEALAAYIREEESVHV